VLCIDACFVNIQQCFCLEDDEGSDSTGTILGLSLGLGIPALIFITWLLFKFKVFKKLKQSWNNCVSSVRRRINHLCDCFHPQPQPQ